jgi:hypothetical protein
VLRARRNASSFYRYERGRTGTQSGTSSLDFLARQSNYVRTIKAGNGVVPRGKGSVTISVPKTQVTGAAARMETENPPGRGGGGGGSRPIGDKNFIHMPPLVS